MAKIAEIEIARIPLKFLWINEGKGDVEKGDILHRKIGRLEELWPLPITSSYEIRPNPRKPNLVQKLREHSNFLSYMSDWNVNDYQGKISIK